MKESKNEHQRGIEHTGAGTALLVLGMHRSGTSALTRVLNFLGASLPSKLLVGSDGNDAGHWEPDSLVRLNDRILLELESSWNDWRSVDVGRLSQERLKYFSAEIRKCLTSAYGNERFVVIKDPRICRLTFLYENTIEELWENIHYIIPYRNPVSVAKSLERRDEMTNGFAGLLWLRHVVEAEAATRGKSRYFLSYEDLLGDWRGELKAMSRAFEIGWPREIEQADQDISSFLSIDFQHNRHTDKDLDDLNGIIPWTKEAYMALKEMSRNSMSSSALDTFDRIGKEFDAGAAIFGDATIPEIVVRERRVAKSIGYWKALAARSERRPKSGQAIARDAFSQEIDPTIGSDLANAELSGRVPDSKLEKGLEVQGFATKGQDAIEDASRHVRGRPRWELNEVRPTLSDNVERLNEAELRIVELTDDLANARRELGRILNSRSYRLSRRMQHAYQRSSALRRVANIALASRWLGVNRSVAVSPGQSIVGDSVRQRIVRCGLFDESYYRRRYEGAIKNPDDLLSDYLASDPGELRDPGPLFSSRFYLNAHVDVAASGMNPLLHYVFHGAAEGRIAFSPDRVRQHLANTRSGDTASFVQLLAGCRDVNVLCAQNGNFFFHDIAQYISQLLNEQGVQAGINRDLPKESDIADVATVVVAPHEYFYIGPGKEWDPERINRAILVNTEQWQTPWFSKCFLHLMNSEAGVVDINPNSAAGLAKLGAKAVFLPIVPIVGSVFEQKRSSISKKFAERKYIQRLQYPKDVLDRVYDVSYVAVWNGRRGKAIAELASCLSGYNCFIHSPKFSRPITEKDPDMLSGSDLTQIAKNTKILLNIHRDHIGYMEWHRIVLYGIMNGCVVVTEPCFENEYVIDGVNYISAPLSEIPGLLTELLDTDAGRARLKEISENNSELYRAVEKGNRFLL